MISLPFVSMLTGEKHWPLLEQNDKSEHSMFGKRTWLVACHHSMPCVPSKLPGGMAA